MKNTLFVSSLALTCFLASCSKEEENSGPKVGDDIKTGISVGGSEIVIKNANIGATEIGGAGSYLTWEDAVRQCPDGYRLVSRSDLEALFGYLAGGAPIDPSQPVNVDPLLISFLRLPLAGYIQNGTVIAGNEGHYFLLEGNENAANGLIIKRVTVDGKAKLSVQLSSNIDPQLQLQARCIKAPAI